MEYNGSDITYNIVAPLLKQVIQLWEGAEVLLENALNFLIGNISTSASYIYSCFDTVIEATYTLITWLNASELGKQLRDIVATRPSQPQNQDKPRLISALVKTLVYGEQEQDTRKISQVVRRWLQGA